MSDRPTEEQVDKALLDYDGCTTTCCAVGVLCDEVRALREDLEIAEIERDGANKRAAMMLEQKELFRAETERLKATLARVAALPNKWLDDVAYQRESVADCAYDVEQALKGEP